MKITPAMKSHVNTSWPLITTGVGPDVLSPEPKTYPRIFARESMAPAAESTM